MGPRRPSPAMALKATFGIRCLLPPPPVEVPARHPEPTPPGRTPRPGNWGAIRDNWLEPRVLSCSVVQSSTRFSGGGDQASLGRRERRTQQRRNYFRQACRFLLLQDVHVSPVGPRAEAATFEHSVTQAGKLRPALLDPALQSGDLFFHGPAVIERGGLGGRSRILSSWRRAPTESESIQQPSPWCGREDLNLHVISDNRF